MLCFHPRDIKVQQKVTFSHYVDRYIRVPCGKCYACRRRRQQDWAFRIQQEADSCQSLGGSVYFITLTYSSENLFYQVDKDSGELFDVPSLDPSAIGTFIRHLRNRFDSMFGKLSENVSKVRYFGCGEYGDKMTENERPHYHIVLFLRENISAEKLRPLIEASWNKGLVLGIHSLTPKLAEYVAKYSMKRLGEDCSEKVAPFARMSLKPAIGSVFLSSNQCKAYTANQSFVVYDFTGTSFSLPRYFRDRMYSKDVIDNRRLSYERQLLTINECLSRKDPLHLIHRYQANVRFEENFIRNLNIIRQKYVK